MSAYRIYHNTRCRKCREALKFLQEKGLDPDVTLYLNEVPTTAEFEMLLAKLHLTAREVVRTEETLYREKYRNSNFTDNEWITIMLENPKLIQRPIITKGHKAVIGRSLENLEKIIE